MIGEMRTMDGTGDTKVTWDTEKPAEVEAARETFYSLKKQGYAGYRVTRGGEKDEILHEFDPHAGLLIMAPPMVGG